ncbi:hypothetical protein KP79_PYT10722 [Mizuhopecten yessoensis]|uniref:Uncharacterized protein n=1 Tax=Mizuhopecten yessoensis TaxID=6573 RepID=A0A210PPK3_MIZYE|nr:hypothetical protein KP79_PYT10722 [Mizuhopecten yessoensis]
MDEAEKFAKSRGYSTMYLTTHDKQDFYKHLRGYGTMYLTTQDKQDLYKHLCGYCTMYLTTHDKQDFYKHLNYNFCDPVISFGADPKLIPDCLIKQLTATTLRPQEKEQETSDKQNNALSELHQTNLPSPSPPPPPPPTTAPLPPPPPPPPSYAPLPPPPPPTTAKTVLGKPEIVKWDPRNISWMRKDLS